MSEMIIANVALTFRVFLLGGFLLLLPRVTRKGLLFGVYVGELFAESDSARHLVRGWRLGCGFVMLISLAVGYGMSLAGRPVAGSLTGTAVFLVAGFGLYLRFYFTTRRLTPADATQPAPTATASLEADDPRAERFAKAVVGLCLAASLGTIVYATVGYEAMPQRIPALTGSSSGMGDKSLVGVLFLPSVNLVFSPFYALLALLTARAKRSVRGGAGGGSAEAQEAFRTTVANLFSWFALLICALLTVTSVQIVRIGLSRTASLGAAVWGLAVIFVVFALANLIRILLRHGQGGALRESGSRETPLTGGLADNAHWVLGMFYVDRDDPSIMVEARFGIGYSLNYGNRNAVMIVGSMAVLTVGLAAFGLIGLLL